MAFETNFKDSSEVSSLGCCKQCNKDVLGIDTFSVLPKVIDSLIKTLIHYRKWCEVK